MEFALLREALERARSAIGAEIAAAFDGRAGSDLEDAMSYALGGGKMLRGFLVLEGARLHGAPPEAAAKPALAVECVHAYSLIHDDLPCMDDDDLRRGKPTVHRKWNEHTAVLAGDALQALAFELVADAPLAPDAALRLARGLAAAAGRDGMVGGQALDIASEAAEAPPTLEEIVAVQRGKTGALIAWSAAAGAHMAGADAGALERYGRRLGLAYQVADDILDVEGSAEALGKRVRKDADAGKATFVRLLGLEGARRRAAELVDEACGSLERYGEDAERLRDVARFAIVREN